jgi:hypothetical protein
MHSIHVSLLLSFYSWQSATYVFSKCEEHLWIVAAVHNEGGAHDHNMGAGTGVHDLGLRRLVELAYSMFTMLYGRVDAVLEGRGWEVVLEVKRLRKALRKLLREHR